MRVAVLAVMVAAFACYWNSFDVPFVFDDFSTIERNEAVRSGDALTPKILGGRSLLYATFAANYAIHGLDVWGYHLVNIVLHGLNGVLVLILARRWFHGLIPPLLAALFFVVHPIQTESVTYISSRSELLATFFVLMGVLIFVTRKTGVIVVACIAACLWAGLQSKEIAIVLPALILAVNYFQGGPMRWRVHLPFIGAGAAIGAWFLVGPLWPTVAAPGNITMTEYAATQARVITRYFELVVWPVGLNLDWDVRVSSVGIAVSIAFICATLAAAWFLRTVVPVASLGIAWTYIALAPSSSIVPISDVAFEHRMYLPMVGVSLLFASVVRRAT